MSKLRVWWIPQLGNNETFYIPVKTPEEGKKMLDVLAAYDAFQLQNNLKLDCYNVGGLQSYDEEKSEWHNWEIKSDGYCYNDIGKYCESEDCLDRDELSVFSYVLLSQIDWSRY